MKKTTPPILKPSAKDAGEADSIVLDFRAIDKNKYWHGPRSGSVSFGRKGLCFEGDRIKGWPHETCKSWETYVFAPCSRKEAEAAPAGSMALHTRRYGYCELVPLDEVCDDLIVRFLLDPLPEPDDILLLMARLHSEKRLSRAEISYASEILKKASRQPRSDSLLGMPREDYPLILHCKGFALSPATVRHGPLPPQLLK